ncbi:MAG: (2Fe-2S)-binding protein [Alphaproteobacteria bacterium]|nr:(2Fe-2S)-binding protein [Alphaproteobacteria bacterium]
MSYRIKVNGTSHDLDIDGDTPLLWALRDNLGLTGSKYACGIGACGACTVMADGRVLRSCSIPVEAAIDLDITTIEGLAKDKGDGRLHPLQQAWIDEDVPQCGYCQTGQIMAAAALLKETRRPTDEDIDISMSNICRCGTYNRIRAAIRRVAPAPDRG